MKLIKLWDADLEKGLALHYSFKWGENGFDNPCMGMDLEMYEQYVYLKKGHSEGKLLKPEAVPATIYILADQDDNYVGIFNLRHEINIFLEEGAGHIGYGIKEECRNKGYGTEGLRLVLQEAKKLGINEAYLACGKDNIASLKVMLKNGGYIHHSNEYCHFVRIPIK